MLGHEQVGIATQKIIISKQCSKQKVTFQTKNTRSLRGSMLEILKFFKRRDLKNDRMKALTVIEN